MASIKIEQPVRIYHPAFNSPYGDIVLYSTDSTYYRIPSYVLPNTSGFFRTLLPAPFVRPNLKTEACPLEEPIAIDEKDSILERILFLISGLETSKWESFDQLEAVVSLAQKWDAPGPLSIIRSAITGPVFLAQPLRLYILAVRCGWEQEAKIASTYTLTLSLYEDKHTIQLTRLPSKDLMTLLAFHRIRRDEFKKFIDTEGSFDGGNVDSFCEGCGEPKENYTWRELKARMFYEMDQRPLGDTLCGLEMEEWAESIACWDAKCPKVGCGRLNYHKINTLRNIKAGLALLPISI